MFLPFLAAFSQFLSYSNSVETDYEIEYSSSFVGIGKFHFPTEQILIRMFFITQYGIEFVSFFAGEAFHEHLPVFQQLLHHRFGWFLFHGSEEFIIFPDDEFATAFPIAAAETFLPFDDRIAAKRAFPQRFKCFLFHFI